MKPILAPTRQSAMSTAFERARRLFEFGLRDSAPQPSASFSFQPGRRAAPEDGPVKPGSPYATPAATARGQPPSLAEFEARTGRAAPTPTLNVASVDGVQSGNGGHSGGASGSSSGGASPSVADARAVWREVNATPRPRRPERHEALELVRDGKRFSRVCADARKRHIWRVTLQRDLGAVTLPNAPEVLEDVGLGVDRSPRSSRRSAGALISGAMTHPRSAYVGICDERLYFFDDPLHAFVMGAAPAETSLAGAAPDAAPVHCVPRLMSGAGSAALGAVPLATCHVLLAGTDSGDGGNATAASPSPKKSASRPDRQRGAGVPETLRLELPCSAFLLRFESAADAIHFGTLFAQQKQAAVLCARVRHWAAAALQAAWRGARVRLQRQRTNCGGPSGTGGAHRGRVARRLLQLLDAEGLSPERAALLIQSAYRGYLGRQLCARMEKAYSIARQRRMNCRIEGSCLVGSPLVAKAWIRGGLVSLQWSRSETLQPTAGTSGAPHSWEPIPGAQQRIYVPTGKDLSRVLSVRWTVRSVRAGAVVDLFEAITRPIDLDVASEEATILQSIERRPRFAALCVRLFGRAGQTTAVSAVHAAWLHAGGRCPLALQSKEVAIRPATAATPERSVNHSAASSSSSSSSTPMEWCIPYEFVEVDVKHTADPTMALLTIGDAREEVILELQAEHTAQRNVAVVLLDRMRLSAAARSRDAAANSGIGRFARAAAAAASSVTATAPAGDEVMNGRTDIMTVSAPNASLPITRHQRRRRGKIVQSGGMLQRLSRSFAAFSLAPRTSTATDGETGEAAPPALDVDEAHTDPSLTPLVERFRKRLV